MVFSTPMYNQPSQPLAWLIGFIRGSEKLPDQGSPEESSLRERFCVALRTEYKNGIPGVPEAPDFTKFLT
jgi:hypothetical protein